MGAKWNYTLLALLAFVFAKAQVNLVPNGSFEDTIQCPDFTGQINRANYWSTPTNATPDIITSNYCDVYLNSNMIDSPINVWGFQYPRTGDNYAGLGVYSNNSGGVDREYIQVHLKSSLISGKKYFVKYYVSLADKLDYYAIKNIDAYFSIDSIYEQSSLPNLPILNFDPQVNATTFITDTISWKEVFGYFTATGGEQYMIIGNFNVQDQVDTIIFDSTTNIKMTYYYIDDVSVYECDSLIGLDENLLDEIQIYPNPAQDFVNIDLAKNINHAQLSIYNLTGQLVMQKQITQPNQNIPITELGNGVYVFVVESGGAVVGRKRVVVAR